MSTQQQAAAPKTAVSSQPINQLNPDTHKAHTESTTTIHLALDDTAFLNPVQQFNRDLSISCIRAWGELRKEEAEAKHERKKLNQQKKAERQQKSKSGKVKEGDESTRNGEAVTEENAERDVSVAGPSRDRSLRIPKFTILEALAATGLRSIRYAKEIPDVKVVLANDLSASACDAMRMNIALNGVGEDEPSTSTKQDMDVDAQDNKVDEVVEQPKEEDEEAVTASVGVEADDEESIINNAGPSSSKSAIENRREGCTGKVRVNQGDACEFMYSRRDPKKRVDVVDLDPYGTAAPFIDAAIGCIADGGLLAVTCTDSAVFAGSQYPEKAFANYGGASVNAEYCHEVGLRLVLNSLSTCAARYGRYIEPLISFSVDFYLRLFLRVHTGPAQVKDLPSKIGIVHVCGFCQSYVTQPFGRIQMRTTNNGGQQKLWKTAQTVGAGENCEHCGSHMHVGGPMWLGPLHDPEFAKRALRGIEGKQDDYGTWGRMHGMLTTASEELPDPFYFTMNKMCGYFHSSSGTTKSAANALLNAGYKISRSHAVAGSIKTDAPRSFILDIVREFIKENPVRMDKISENSPSRALLAGQMTHEIDFKPHPELSAFEKGSSGKVVRYQMNPLPNWGPATKARIITGGGKKVNGRGNGGEKRRNEGDEIGGEGSGKKAKVEGDLEVDEEAGMNA